MADAQFAQMPLVQQGQARRKKLAEDHSLRKARNHAESDAAGKLHQRVAHPLLVAGVMMLDAVAQHHPVDGDAVRLGRSEEHTSELQSLMRISYAVFCLKKKNTNMTTCTKQCTHKHSKLPPT